MAVRNIDYYVENGTLTPAVLSWGGIENEHNATDVRYTISSQYIESLGENVRFRIDFLSSGAGYDPSENLELNDFVVKRAIPKKFTQYGGKMTASLVITRFLENNAVEEILSIPAEIYFTPSNRKNEELVNNLSACEEYFLSLLKRADDVLSETKILNEEIDRKIREFGLENELNLSQCVKKDEFADSKGNGGILRINPDYGISSGRYSASSPKTGDTVIIQTPSNGLIMQRTQKYMPITPSNIDYAVKCALAYSKLAWTETEKAQARSFLGIETRKYIIDNQPVDGDVYVADEALVAGNTYFVSYYSSEFPGWITGKGNENPINEPCEFAVIATNVEVNGQSYIGLEIETFAWANGVGSKKAVIYQDGDVIKIDKEFGGSEDKITVYTK